MKSVICAIVMLCLIVGLTFFTSLYSHHTLEEMTKDLDFGFDNSTYESSENAMKELRSDYESFLPFITLFINENEARDLEKQIMDLESAVRSQSLDDIITEKNRLAVLLTQLKRLSILSPEAIL